MADDSQIMLLRRALNEQDPFDRGTVHVHGYDVERDIDGDDLPVVRVTVHLDEPEGETWNQSDLLALRRHLASTAARLGVDDRVVTALDPLASTPA